MTTNLTPPFPPHPSAVALPDDPNSPNFPYAWLARRHSRDPSIPSTSKQELRQARTQDIPVGIVVANSGHSPLGGPFAAMLFALEALTAVAKTGQRTGTTLFYDVCGNYPRESLPVMLRFFDKLAQVNVDAGFNLGAYGPWSTIEYLLDQGAIQHAWVSNVPPSRSHLPNAYIQQLPGGWHEVRCATHDGLRALELAGLSH